MLGEPPRRALVVLALALLLGVAGVAGCQRLNPRWCAGNPCAAGEICVPESNTCVRPEGGIVDLLLDAGTPEGGHPDAVSDGNAADSAPVDLAAEAALDAKLTH